MNKKEKQIQKDYLINCAGKGHYTNLDAPEKLLRYANRTNGQSNYDLITWGGLGILEFLDMITNIDLFEHVQRKRSRKGNFGRYMDHEIYSFSDESEASIKKYNVDVDKLARKMAYDFYNTDNCQVIYAVHKPSEKDTHMHIHFVINTVNFVNCNKRRENMRQTKEREARFREMTERAIAQCMHGKQ